MVTVALYLINILMIFFLSLLAGTLLSHSLSLSHLRTKTLSHSFTLISLSQSFHGRTLTISLSLASATMVFLHSSTQSPLWSHLPFWSHPPLFNIVFFICFAPSLATAKRQRPQPPVTAVVNGNGLFTLFFYFFLLFSLGFGIWILFV